MSTGMNVSDAANTALIAVEKGQSSYAVFLLDEGQNDLALDVVSERSATYADFLAALPSAEPRFALYHYQLPESARSALVRFVWLPLEAGVVDRANYDLVKDDFAPALSGTVVTVQGVNLEEMSEDVVRQKLGPTG
ncbi:cofilin family protein [Streptomyces sp. NPDC048441]|uniref:cofilin family protein n=1 Tax=Streptomyces sp. NPDC048441 TaxID=3365552 RepID=UPI003719CCBC